jgi:hypothetical protein
MYDGILQEVINNPNRAEMIKLRGEWTPVNPSTYDPDMRAQVNPYLGKGTDQSRVVALQGIAAAQMTIIEKFGMGNGVVGPQELRNTQVDILGLVGFKNATRYFREITPQQAAAMEQAPKQPDPTTLLAQAQMEGVKSKTATAVGKQKQTETKLNMDEDFRRDKLNVDSLVQLVSIFKDFAVAMEPEQEVEALNSRGS